uniref:Uncharacterized protein n=1 Tax=Arundo donax TaxID=35708 RepID=A0A0A8ZAN7_ARUDO
MRIGDLREIKLIIKLAVVVSILAITSQSLPPMECQFWHGIVSGGCMYG